MQAKHALKSALLQGPAQMTWQQLRLVWFNPTKSARQRPQEVRLDSPVSMDALDAGSYDQLIAIV
jgi:hypothetical protein